MGNGKWEVGVAREGKEREEGERKKRAKEGREGGGMRREEREGGRREEGRETPPLSTHHGLIPFVIGIIQDPKLYPRIESYLVIPTTTILHTDHLSNKNERKL
jgi:hypothetical protein